MCKLGFRFLVICLLKFEYHIRFDILKTQHKFHCGLISFFPIPLKPIKDTHTHTHTHTHANPHIHTHTYVPNISWSRKSKTLVSKKSNSEMIYQSAVNFKNIRF